MDRGDDGDDEDDLSVNRRGTIRALVGLGNCGLSEENMRTCLVKSLGWGRVLPKVGCSGRGRIGWGDVRKCRGAVEANEEATTSVSVIEVRLWSVTGARWVMGR